MVIGQGSLHPCNQTTILSKITGLALEKGKTMKTKIVWGGAILTVLLVLGISFYRQFKKALGDISFAISRVSIDAYLA